MTEYLFGDVPIDSAPRLPLLRQSQATVAMPVLTVTHNRRAMGPRRIRRWRHQWRDDQGRMVMGLQRTSTGYMVRFPRQCDFDISADATHIDVRPYGAMAPEVLEHLLADQVLPRCLAQRGELVVHAAGIAFGTDIALFVGESGRGKSTLAGLFLRAGKTVLTDDCLLVRPTPEAVRAFPTYPSLRLQPDSVDALFPRDAAGRTLRAYSDKQRFVVADAPPEVAAGPVAAVYFLGGVVAGLNDVRIEPLAPATSCIRLMEQSFQLDVLDADAIARLLERASKVVTRVQAFALDFPRDFGRTASLLAQIEQHFADAARRPTAP